MIPRAGFLFVASLFVITPYAIERALDRPSISQRYFFEMAVLLGAAAYSLSRLLGIARRPPTDLIRPWILLYAASLAVSAIFSPNPLPIFMNMLFPLSCMAFYMIAYAVPWSTNGVAKLISFLAIAVYFASAFGLVQGAGIKILPYVDRQIPGHIQVLSIFGHPNYAASFFGPSLFLIGGWIWHGQTSSKRPSIQLAVVAIAASALVALVSLVILERSGALCLFAAACIGVIAWRFGVFMILTALSIIGCLLISGTRGVWVALAASAGLGLVMALWVGRWDRASLLRYGIRLTIALVILVLVIAISPLGSYVMERFRERQAIAGRLYAYSIATEMVQERPLQGWGYGSFATEYFDRVVRFQQRPGSEAYSQLLNDMGGVPPGEVHNDLLAVAVDAGLSGVFFLLGILCVFFITIMNAAKVASRSRLPGGNPGPPRQEGPTNLHRSRLLIVLGAALLCILVDGLFSFPLRLATSAMLFWGVLAIGSRLSQEIGAGTGT